MINLMYPERHIGCVGDEWNHPEVFAISLTSAMAVVNLESPQNWFLRFLWTCYWA